MINLEKDRTISKWLKMLLAVLVLSGILNDIQAHYANETDSILHNIHRRNVYGDGKSLCPDMSVQECARKRPRLLKQCKICGLYNVPPNAGEKLHHHFMIIKGVSVNPPHKYPWMVVLMKGRKKSCGGAILNDRYILSAAHCVVKTFPGKQGKKKFQRYVRPSEVRIGFLTKTKEVTPGPPLSKIIVHPGYHPKHMKYDISLLKLSRRITCNMLRNPICLPTFLPKLSFQRFKNARLHITGWGAVSAVPKVKATRLQEGMVRMTSLSECLPHVSNPVARKFLSQILAFCVKGVNGQRPCFGDSGGSLFTHYKKRYITVGVASFHTCKKCSEHKPAIYTNIRSFLPWIIKNMNYHRSYPNRKGFLSGNSPSKQTKQQCKNSPCKQTKQQCKNSPCKQTKQQCRNPPCKETKQQCKNSPCKQTKQQCKKKCNP